MLGQKTQELVRFAAGRQWVEENKQVLLDQNPDQWLEVRGGKVLASRVAGI